MIKFITFIFLFITFSIQANENSQKLAQIKRLDNFIIASCNRENLKQPMWQYMLQDNPQLYIWGGDNVYGDKKPHKDNLKLKYEIQNNHPDYKKLKELTPIIGIWDDHDFGANNGGKVPHKEKNRQLFFDFIEEPQDSARRSHEGVYTSYTFGDSTQKVKMIMLDIRFNQTKSDLLGEKQWQWLEAELQNNDAKITFIQSGIPFTTPPIIRTEEWADYPSIQKRLFSLIEKYQPPGLIFLSGDKHFSAIVKTKKYLEFVASGLTHESPLFVRRFLRKKFPVSYFALNYMKVSINWDSHPLSVTAEIKGQGHTPIKKSYQLIDQTFQSPE